MVYFLRAHPLRLILVLGLVHGLLYVFLVPPWQHYDEPTHFEYAWLLANRPGLTQPGDYDQAMRRAIAVSMIEHNFFKGMGFLPDLDVQGEPVWIGVSQVGDPPLYYLLVSIPLHFFSAWDVTHQLYIARFVSLSLYLLSILVAWGMMKELAPDRHALRWMVPLSMVLLPGYTDLMTSVNNDVGATLLFCLFLWGCVHLIRQGFSFSRFFVLIIIALSCFWMKETVILALPLLALVLLFALFRNRWRWVPWLALAVLMSIILIYIFSWGDALFWVRNPTAIQKKTTRVSSVQAPLGRYVLNLEVAPNGSPSSVLQLLPENQIKAMRGKTVTLGAWVWASQPLVTNAFYLDGGQKNFSYQLIRVGTSPTFFALSAKIAENASLVRVLLSPNGQENAETITVFYDGLVMAEGARPLDEIPEFDDFSAQKGTWGGAVFYNLLRNASMEREGLGIQPWVENIKTEDFRAMPSPSWVLNSLFDWEWTGWYYQETAQYLLNTYWAKFGWGHVPLLPFTDQFYFLLQVITLVGVGGAGVRLLRRGLTQPWILFFFLGFAVTGIWAQTALRGIQSLMFGTIFIPPARYAYPAIILTMLVLNVGWLEIGQTVGRWIRLPFAAKYMVYFLFFLGLDAAAIASLIHFYAIK